MHPIEVDEYYYIRHTKIHKIFTILNDYWCIRYIDMLDWPKKPQELVFTDIISFIKSKLDYESNDEVFMYATDFINEWDFDNPYIVNQSDVCIDELIKILFYNT